jgi:opacity protein-like surface antigen
VYGTQRLKQNLQLSTLMLNGNVDIIDFNPVKLFATAGIGVATHKTRHRITGFDSENNIINNQFINSQICNEIIKDLNFERGLEIINIFDPL